MLDFFVISGLYIMATKRLKFYTIFYTQIYEIFSINSKHVFLGAKNC